MSIVIARNMVLGGALADDDGSDPNSPLVGWQSFVTPSGLVATFEDPLHPVTNLANPSTAEGWRSTNAGDQYIYVTLGGYHLIDYVALALHNFGTSQTPIQVEVVGSNDQWTPVTSEFILRDDSPVIIQFDDVETPQIRIRLFGGRVPPRAAVLYVGRLLRLQRNIYVGHTPINYGRRIQVTNGRSESGHFLGRIVTGQTKETQVHMRNLSPNWYRTRMDQFFLAAVERPFFWSWRPQDYPREIGFCWMTGDGHMENQLPNGMVEVQFNMGGIAGEAGDVRYIPPPGA